MANRSMDMVKPWLEEKAPQYDPAWAWKQAMEKHTAPPPSERLASRKEGFRTLMKTFLRDCPDKNVKIVNFDGSTTWEEVQEEATAAFDEYTRQGHSWRHPFRSSARLLGATACRIEFLLKLIPSGDYLGILCGGLSLVYDAARRRKDIRELIIRSLDSLSEHIQESSSYIRIYAWDENIRQRTEDFYIAILEAIEGITKWLQKPYLAGAVKSFFSSADYGKDLEEQITTNIQEKATAFEAAVTRCLHHMAQTIHQNILILGGKMDNVSRAINAGNQIVRDTASETTREIKATVNIFQIEAMRTVEELLMGLSKDLQELYDEKEERLKTFLLEQAERESRQANFLVLMTQPAQPIISVAQLLSLLNTETPGSYDNTFNLTVERIQAERDYVLFFGRNLKPFRQSGISFITNNDQFQQWFKSMQSQTLIIHGMDPELDQCEIVSPFSYMCAMLAQTTTRTTNLYSLVHFCRLSTNPEHRFYGANGLLRSLISQLIVIIASTQQHPDLSFIGLMEIEVIRAKDVPSLCRLFEELLKRVGAGIIFCLLDATSWLECEPHVPHMHMVMQFLNSLVEAVEASQTGLVLKLLVTNSTTSQYSRDWFPNSPELYVPNRGLLEGQGVNILPIWHNS